MATSLRSVARTFAQRLGFVSLEQKLQQQHAALPINDSSVPYPRSWGPYALRGRQEFVETELGISIDSLAGRCKDPDPESLRGMIEQQIGWARIPLGMAGPLRVRGSSFNADVFLPLATSEGALVASMDRGARALSQSGGAYSICVSTGIQRAPSFLFEDMSQALRFLAWIDEHSSHFAPTIREVSRYAVLQEVRPNLDGNLVSLILEYTTGDAAGQNMVTVCTDALCRFILSNCPITPRSWFIEGNLSGDKRATTLSLQGVRGHKVVAEAIVPENILRSILRTDQRRMMEYWKVAAINGIHSGSVGVQGHFANPLAALFCACGQDIACVAESAVGVTRFEERLDGALYASVTLPGLVVGTVGGGTRLPTAQECLAILGCSEGEGKVQRFAEICAAAVLAGELSMLAALSSGDFARAHALFGRRPK